MEGNNHAMAHPATAPWNIPLSTTDMSRLTAGLEPQSNDDKWRISVRPHWPQQQLTSVLFARGGTNKRRYILHLDTSEQKLHSITWEQKRGEIKVVEDVAKKEVVRLARAQLECDIEALPEYTMDGLFYNNETLWEDDQGQNDHNDL